MVASFSDMLKSTVELLQESLRDASIDVAADFCYISFRHLEQLMRFN